MAEVCQAAESHPSHFIKQSNAQIQGAGRLMLL
jgi:hypothetical protein